MTNPPDIEPFIPPSPSEILAEISDPDTPPEIPPSTVDSVEPEYELHDKSIYVYRPPHRMGWQTPQWTGYWPAWTPLSVLPIVVPTDQAPRILLHYQLRYNPYHHEAGPEIIWDVIHPPELCARVPDRSAFRRWKEPAFALDAVQPTATKVWILSDLKVLAYWMQRWGPIVVRSERVTILDILQGIYTYLQTPLTHDEIREISGLPGNRDSLRCSRAQRAKDSLALEAVVLKHGYKRVDVVGSHRKFHGMRVDFTWQDNKWRLFLGLSQGPVPRLF